MVKTVSVDPDGKEQALGLYLPGEAIGLSGISPEHYPCDAASETVSRLFTRMRDQGLIRIEGRQLEIIDGDGLRKLARNAIERCPGLALRQFIVSTPDPHQWLAPRQSIPFDGCINQETA